MTDPLAFTIPSTSSPSSSSGGVTLEAIIAQLQHMDARLDTFNDELCQVNTYVSHIAQRQARLSGVATSPSPSLDALVDEDSDDGVAHNDKDKDASSFQ